ncbi:NUDIX domain-containing protein [Cytobacillus suaedae]|nr:NUDIX domain-containing protein [Cytobacillus suaedae]
MAIYNKTLLIRGIVLRDRASVVIIENYKVGLIKRIREGTVYFVFPGGGIENGETPEDGAKREALEELGVEVKVNDCIAEVEFNGTQYFFLSEIIVGEFGTGQGEEYIDEKRDRGTYLPMWVDLDKLSSIDVKPKEVALKVLSLF